MSESTFIQRLDVLSDTLERHDHLLLGNGSQGLVTTVQLLKTDQDRTGTTIDKLEARCARMEKFMYVATGVVVAGKLWAELFLGKH